MDTLITKHREGFGPGYTAITRAGEPGAVMHLEEEPRMYRVTRLSAVSWAKAFTVAWLAGTWRGLQYLRSARRHADDQ